MIALERLAQHFRFALRTIKVDRLAARALRDADQLREARPIVEQGVDTRIDRIDAVANVVEIGTAGSVRLRCRRAGPGCGAFARPGSRTGSLLFVSRFYGVPCADLTRAYARNRA